MNRYAFCVYCSNEMELGGIVSRGRGEPGLYGWHEDNPEVHVCYACLIDLAEDSKYVD